MAQSYALHSLQSYPTGLVTHNFHGPALTATNGTNALHGSARGAEPLTMASTNLSGGPDTANTGAVSGKGLTLTRHVTYYSWPKAASSIIPLRELAQLFKGVVVEPIDWPPTQHYVAGPATALAVALVLTPMPMAQHVSAQGPIGPSGRYDHNVPTSSNNGTLYTPKG